MAKFREMSLLFTLIACFVECITPFWRMNFPTIVNGLPDFGIFPYYLNGACIPYFCYVLTFSQSTCTCCLPSPFESKLVNDILVHNLRFSFWKYKIVQYAI